MHLGCKLPFTVIIYAPEKVVDASKSKHRNFLQDNNHERTIVKVKGLRNEGRSSNTIDHKKLSQNNHKTLNIVVPYPQ